MWRRQKERIPAYPVLFNDNHVEWYVHIWKIGGKLARNGRRKSQPNGFLLPFYSLTRCLQLLSSQLSFFHLSISSFRTVYTYQVVDMNIERVSSVVCNHVFNFVSFGMSEQIENSKKIKYIYFSITSIQYFIYLFFLGRARLRKPVPTFFVKSH